MSIITNRGGKRSNDCGIGGKFSLGSCYKIEREYLAVCFDLESLKIFDNVSDKSILPGMLFSYWGKYQEMSQGQA